MAAAVLAVSLYSCHDESSQAFFADDELPKIFMEWSNVMVVEATDILSFSPRVSPSDNANFSWSINGREISTSLELNYEFFEDDDFVLRFDVERNGIRTHRTANVMIRRDFDPQPYVKRSVAFINAETALLEDIQWRQITHLVLAGAATVDSVGDVTLRGFNRSDFDIDLLVRVAHNFSVFVLLDVATHHNDTTGFTSYGIHTFEYVVQDAGRRNRVISQTMAAVHQYGFDGVNIYFDRQTNDTGWAEVASVRAFFEEFAAAVPVDNLTHEGHPFFLTTSILQTWTNNAYAGFLLPKIDRIDWYHVYAFGAEDLNGAPHSSPWFFGDATQTWVNRGLPANRMVPVAAAFGVQYEFRGQTATWPTLHEFIEWMPFRTILRNHPTAYTVNMLPIADGLFFDGFPAIDEKAAAVVNNGWAGMGLWKVCFDVTDERSLLRRMNLQLGN